MQENKSFEDENEDELENKSIGNGSVNSQEDFKKKYFTPHSNHIKIGIIGTTNVGKSALFNCFLNRDISPVENGIFTTIDPYVGTFVPFDHKFDFIAKKMKPKSLFPSNITIIDSHGIIKNSFKGEGLGMPPIAQYLHADVLINLVRGFDDPNLTHYYETVDPVRDIDFVLQELMMQDIWTLEEAISGIEDSVSLLGEGGKYRLLEYVTYVKAWHVLVGKKRPHPLRDARKKIIHVFYPDKCQGTQLRCALWENIEMEVLAKLPLWTTKEIVHVLNVPRRHYLSNFSPYLTAVQEYLQRVEGKYQNAVVLVSVGFELEFRKHVSEEVLSLGSTIASLSPAQQLQEAIKILTAANPTHLSALPKILRECHRALQLIHFYVSSSDLLRCYCLRYGKSNADASALVDTMIHRHLIRGDVIAFEEYFKYDGNRDNLLFDQKIRGQGKSYIVNEGDIIDFRYHDFQKPSV